MNGKTDRSGSGALMTRAGSWLLGLLLAGVVMADGIGGTGAPLSQHEGSGIGGTGQPVEASGSSGIGGTGRPLAASEGSEGSGIGGTGIVGVVTAFGSIWVNGVEVHYPADTVIDTPAGPRDSGQLAIGQLVLVSGDRTGGQATSNDIQLLPAVSGPVTAATGSAERMTVAGQPVMLTPATTGARPVVGDWVTVHGLQRSDGTIMATSLSPRPAGGQVMVYGQPTAGPAPGQLRVQNLPVVLPPGSRASPGPALLVSGTLRDGILVADQVRGDPIAELAAAHRSLSVQGYVHDADATRVTVGHLDIRLTDTERPSQPPPGIDQLVLIEAHRGDDGSFLADRVDVITLDELGTEGGDATDARTLPSTDEDSVPQTEDREVEEPETDATEPVEVEEETPEAEQPEVESTEAEAPELETPENEVPELESPELETPEVETPEVETPEVETPEVETPEVETPEVEVPEVETPEVETPEIEVPEVETPEIELPELETPELETPEL